VEGGKTGKKRLQTETEKIIGARGKNTDHANGGDARLETPKRIIVIKGARKNGWGRDKNSRKKSFSLYGR